MYKLSLEESLKRLFSTPKGSYILDSNYGLDTSFIDKNPNSIDYIALKDEVLSLIAKYEPRVNIKKASLKIQGQKALLSLEEGITIEL
ncbi:GPW/gp25 family protein [Helicobacter sp. 11S02629-2]|uniref:GPW/gp25 family protein n=1 Tax=Helicobacter sp. 11S02629-2 TaxID=1476195 RepID=UPI000BA57958|nr:GPW/gp25 family protein [Helicobacter sp. 11S02629-2]PAF44177.1 hypothetical protein BKH40_06160 [Helicobacter sp. 11S02629-2]